MANSAICVRGEMVAERGKEGIGTLSILKDFDHFPSEYLEIQDLSLVDSGYRKYWVQKPKQPLFVP